MVHCDVDTFILTTHAQSIYKEVYGKAIVSEYMHAVQGSVDDL